MITILQVTDRTSEQHGKLVLYDTEWGLLTRQSGKLREFTTRSGARGTRSKVAHNAHVSGKNGPTKRKWYSYTPKIKTPVA